MLIILNLHSGTKLSGWLRHCTQYKYSSWLIFSCKFPLVHQLYLCFISSDAADKVVKEGGKFEELVVASKEIAASTAQLVSL